MSGIRWSRMNRQRIMIIVLVGTVVFNILFSLWAVFNVDTTSWFLIDLGPAIIQDSYFYGAPSLESPFGMIGDVPGGYSLYNGGVFDGFKEVNLSEWMIGNELITFGTPPIDYMPIILAIAFTMLPLTIILVIGRRSYGSAKT